jgi:tetratricopeptide (TPR) repeat protein
MVRMRTMTLLCLLVGTAGSAAAAPTANEKLERAKQHFSAGVDAYDQGKYQLALQEFGQAHALSHNAALYFNMAACEEHMDHFQAAALLLKQYLIEKPDAEDRANVQVRIKSLEERDERLHKMVESPTVKSEPTTTAGSETHPSKPRLKYTWVALGVTGAVGIAAIGVGAYTVVHHSDLKTGCGSTATGCSASEIDGLRATAIATDVLIGVTAAAAVATVVVAVLEVRRSRAEMQRATRAPARVAFTTDGLVF